MLKDELEHQPTFQTQGWKRLIEETPGLLDRIQAKKVADEVALESKRKALVEAQVKKTAVRQEVGISLLESVKATQLALAEILQHADIRADFALLGLALDDAHGAFNEARGYYQTLVELTAMEGAAAQAANDRLALPVANETGAASAKTKAFPKELSQYVSRSKEGFHLAALVGHYREAMIQLLLENKMDYDKTAGVLAAKGLNGGTFTGAQLRAVIYQTGLHKEPSLSNLANTPAEALVGKRGFPLMGAHGKVFCCPHRTQTVRQYLAEEIGLDVLAERCSDGAALVLKNQTMDRLLALPLAVSRRTGHAVPRWVH